MKKRLVITGSPLVRQGKHRGKGVRGGGVPECVVLDEASSQGGVSVFCVCLVIYCHPKKAGGPKENGPAVGSVTSALLLLAPDL